MGQCPINPVVFSSSTVLDQLINLSFKKYGAGIDLIFDNNFVKVGIVWPQVQYEVLLFFFQLEWMHKISLSWDK